MDKETISKLTDDELQEHLIKYVSKVPPLTESTRELCENLLSEHINGVDHCDSIPSAFTKPECLKVISSPPKIEPSDIYYSVCTSHALDTETASKYIFTEKLGAINEFKKHKEARFKAFENYDDAMKFAQAGSSILNVSIDPRAVAATEEKPSCFSSPAPQQHIKFRKAIEKGDPSEFELFVDTNPRYLVSKADTPSILKEGPRYNALHVACLANKPTICQKILDVVSNNSLFQKLYPNDLHESHQQRSIRLLDLYLNTPDKGSHRTPLHYAVAFGFIDCVSVLVSYPGCNKIVVDKFGKTPLEISCTRASTCTPDIKERISVLLGEHFYVPLLKDEEQCFSPKVCPPMSPSHCQTIPSIFSSSNKHMSPSYKIQGYAGPMNAEKSKAFFNKLRPSIALSPVRTPKINPSIETVSSAGRELAEKLGTLWTEYWPFLDDFINIRTDEGLQKLENHLQQQLDLVIQERCNDPNFLEEADDPDANKYTRDHEVSIEGNLSKQSAVSSIALLCMELEALRLNRSISPSSSPVKSRSKIIDSKPLVVNYENNNFEGDLIKDDFAVYNYALQSACLTGRKLASELNEFLEFNSSMAHAHLRSVNSKLRPEISSLLTVITRIPLENPVDFRFVHPIAVTQCVEILLESKMSSDLLKLCELMECLDRDGYLFDEECSDDEDSEQCVLSKRQIPHRSCVVHLLAEGLRKIYDICNSASRESFDWRTLPKCTCQWWYESGAKVTRIDTFCSPEAKRIQSRIHDVLYKNDHIPIDNDNVVRRLSFSDEEQLMPDDENESFVSACSSLGDDDESLVTPNEVIPYFIYGSLPDKEDIELNAALGERTIDEKTYPRVFDWRKLVSKLDKNQLNKSSRKQNSFKENPDQFVRGPSFCSTPDLMQRTFKAHLVSSPKRNSPRLY